MVVELRMTERPKSPAERGHPAKTAAPVNIFNGWWLQSLGYALTALYVLYFISLYRAGSWILGHVGCRSIPISATPGQRGAGIARQRRATVQPSRVGEDPEGAVWTDEFLLSELALSADLLPGVGAIGTVSVSRRVPRLGRVTVFGLVAIVYLIVRRRTAISLALAAPFTAWNFLAAQNGFLTGALLGGSLLFLERRPVLAGLSWLPDLQAAIRHPVSGRADCGAVNGQPLRQRRGHCRAPGRGVSGCCCRRLDRLSAPALAQPG